MNIFPHDAEDPTAPLVTLSALDVPITAETRDDGREVHLLIGPITLVLLRGQAADVVTSLLAARAC